MEIRLKAGAADRLLAKNRMTRGELAKEFEVGAVEMNLVLDGKIGADEDFVLLLIAAFGANKVKKAINWTAIKKVKGSVL